MLHRTLAIASLLALIVFGGTAIAGNPNSGNWWQPGDSLPSGDGGPTTLPTGVTYCGDPVTYDLFAGQSTDVGSITIVNDETTLYVTFQASGDNTFETLHLWVGTDLLDVPSTPQGQPIPGQFPFAIDLDGGQTWTFDVELGTEIGGVFVPAACGTDLYVVAHAEVVTDGGTSGEHETAFGGDTPGDGPRWWYYMTYTLQCCDGEEPPTGGSFETAYAKGGWVWTTHTRSNPEDLPSLELTRNRWGWAINLTETGTTTYDIWAGAGLNDTDRGVLVGTLTVAWDGTTATVTYEMDSGYAMSEVHVYAGDLPPATIAPGQYGNIEYFDPYEDGYTGSFGVSDSDGDGVWIVAHAVVFGTF